MILLADLIEIIKKAAMDAVNNAQPSNLIMGTVVQEDPIKIKIDQKLTLESKQLFLARHVTEYETKEEITDEESGEMKKTKTKVKNKLKAGEKVLLVKQAGGQSYFVLDRVV